MSSATADQSTKLSRLPDDIFLSSVPFMDTKSLSALARSCRHFKELVEPELIRRAQIAKQSKMARKSIEEIQRILRYDWNPISMVQVPLYEYDSYVMQVFGLLTRNPTVEEIFDTLETIERRAWDDLPMCQVGEAARMLVSQKLYNLRLFEVNLREPDVLNQVGLKFYTLNKRFHDNLNKNKFPSMACAVYCFAEACGLHPEYLRSRRNLKVALAELRRILRNDASINGIFRDYHLILPNDTVESIINDAMYTN